MMLDKETSEKMSKIVAVFRPYVALDDDSNWTLSDDAPPEAWRAYEKHREFWDEISFS